MKYNLLRISLLSIVAFLFGGTAMAEDKITLDNEAAKATFPFSAGTDDQTATFSNASYFLGSKVTYGSNLSLKGTKTVSDLTQTLFQPAVQDSKADESNAIRFLIQPKYGFTFTPTKVAFKTTRYGTDGGKLDIFWQNTDKTTVSLASGVSPNRNNGSPNYSDLSYDVTGATAGEGVCGLLINLYSLGNTKQVGFCEIVIEGTLTGTEKKVPVLASFKINGTTCAVSDVFGTDYEATYELSKSATMVSAENPLTDITAQEGTLGTVTYEGDATQCKVTIPMSTDDVELSYILNVVQKPDYTLTYINTDGTTMGTQKVEKDAAIGTFAVDYNTATAKENFKVRGWYPKASGGTKFTTESIITDNTNLYAVATEIEVASPYRTYTYNLTDVNFDANDHEAFNPTGGAWHDSQHGWVFNNGTINILVGKKATLSMGLCKYSSDGSTITIKEGENTLQTIDAKVTTDGATSTYEYAGEGGTLTLELSGTIYLHNFQIMNTAETNYTVEGNKYIIKQGDATSFLDALTFLNTENKAADASQKIIYLPNGTYDLGFACLTTISGNNITIQGESQDGVIIKNLPEAEGIGITATLYNTSKYLTLESLTLKNAYPYYDPATGKAAASAGRAVCLQDKGNYTVCKNVTMLSYQDTYYSCNNSSYYYFGDCDIHGLVDFVCGGGDVFYENTTFTLESREVTEGKGDVTIAAPNNAKNYGYVMYNCNVDCKSATFNWGRSWGAPSKLAWINTTLKQPEKIVTSRFTTKGMNCAADAFYEYNTMNEAGENISPASNVLTFTHDTGNKEYETILTAEQAAEYTKEKVFANAPEEFKNRVGLTTGIQNISAGQNTRTQDGAIYNLAGQRVQNATKGIYIINGKKVVIK